MRLRTPVRSVRVVAVRSVGAVRTGSKEIGLTLLFNPANRYRYLVCGISAGSEVARTLAEFFIVAASKKKLHTEKETHTLTSAEHKNLAFWFFVCFVWHFKASV